MNVQTISIPFDEELLPAQKLTAGKLSCIYEQGRLRYLKYGETEAIRMVYFAVRDRNWRTTIQHIEQENIEIHENGFSIEYTSLHTLDDISYHTDVIIKAENNFISLTVKGHALSSFQRNRIGICVLHPIKECQGRKAIVTRPDGTDYNASFPVLISPHQPFREIKEMQYEINEDVRVSLTFDGDTFETEDQRNWSDSSYKTYSTPLDIPFPVTVNKGEIVEQKIEIRITGQESENNTDAPAKEERKIPFPKIGYESVNGQLAEEEIELLKQIPFDHYRAEISLTKDDWQKKLSERIEETKRLNTKLELILFFDDNYKDQLSSFIIAVNETETFIESILVLHRNHGTTPSHILEKVFPGIKKNHPHIKVGYGTDGFFAELNRNRPTGDNFDFVSFSLSPQVHATDTRSVLENLERQADIIQTARSFAQGKQIHVSPVTLKIRVAETETSELPSDHDPRQHHSFGAIWTLSAIRNLGEADLITFCQVKGYRGILNTEQFTSPLYNMLKAIKTFNPKWIIDNGQHHKFLPDKIVMENELGERLEFVVNSTDTFH